MSMSTEGIVCKSTYQIESEGETQQEQPDIQMESVAEDALMRIVKPSSSQRSPKALPENF